MTKRAALLCTFSNVCIRVRWWDHKSLLRLFASFWSTADWSDQIFCLQQEKWISGGKTFNILCLFCRSYELICAWKGWLYVSLYKLLFVFLYHWHFGGLWTTFLQIIMSKCNVMNFHHLFYKTCRLSKSSDPFPCSKQYSFHINMSGLH
jgi:hypothetical protein